MQPGPQFGFSFPTFALRMQLGMGAELRCFYKCLKLTKAEKDFSLCFPPQPSSTIHHSNFCRKPFLGSPPILRVSGAFRRTNQQLQLPVHLPGHVRVPRPQPQRHAAAAGHGRREGAGRPAAGGRNGEGVRVQGGGQGRQEQIGRLEI